MDGENATGYAFIGPASDVAPINVTIRGCEIRNYTPLETPGFNHGAITSKWYESQQAGSGWTVENVDVHHNRGAGIMLTDRSTIRNSHIHHNYSIGAKIAWAPNGALVEGNEIDNNNFDGPPDFNETGGTKFALTTNLTVQQNFVHHNNGAGLWTDIDNIGTVYSDNIVSDNLGPGIEHEISFSATIRNNTVTNNGHQSQGWMWGAGILIANSRDVLVEANEVSGNQSGVGIIHQNRGYVTDSIVVRTNDVTGPGWSGAVQDIGQTSYFAGKATFEDNDYTLSTWVFGGGNLDWTQWQAFGHDDTGSAS